MKPSFLFVVSSFSYFGSLASGAAMQSDEHHEADALDTPTCSSTGNGEDGTTTHKEEFEIAPGSSVLDYLDPALLEDEETLSDVRRSLLEGRLVVIRDAFILEFAEYVWNRLDGDDMNWVRIRDGRNSSSVPGHISYKHRPEPESLSPGLKSALDVLNHTKSRDFFSMISGRQCSETSQMWPSWYKPGDYSAPHTDYSMYRTVTFLWNLSKDWDPKWGGAFYWGSSKTLHDGFHYPTFNTLLLFLPSATSIHSVTPVLEEAEGKRFALGGWYNVDVDVDRLSVHDPLEEKYARREDRMKLTAAEAQWLVYNMSVAPIEDPDRKEKLRRLKGAVFDDCLHPSFESVTIIESADDDYDD